MVAAPAATSEVVRGQAREHIRAPRPYRRRHEGDISLEEYERLLDAIQDQSRHPVATSGRQPAG